MRRVAKRGEPYPPSLFRENAVTLIALNRSLILLVIGVMTVVVWGALNIESSRFVNRIKLRREEHLLIRNSFAHMSRIAQECISHFRTLIRDPKGTLIVSPESGRKRFGIEFHDATETKKARMVFSLCDPRFPHGRLPVYGLADSDWKKCLLAGSAMQGTVTFENWKDLEKTVVQTRLSLWIRDTQRQEPLWKKSEITTELSVPRD